MSDVDAELTQLFSSDEVRYRYDEIAYGQGYQDALDDVSSLAATNPDDLYFAEIARRRISKAERREMIEYQLRGAITQEVTLVLDKYLPRPTYECKDLYLEEDDLDARVMMGKARDRVAKRVQNARENGERPPWFCTQEEWYQEELQILEDEQREQLLKGDT